MEDIVVTPLGPDLAPLREGVAAIAAELGCSAEVLTREDGAVVVRTDNLPVVRFEISRRGLAAWVL